MLLLFFLFCVSLTNHAVLPTISLKNWKLRKKVVGAEIDEALKTVGFFKITDVEDLFDFTLLHKVQEISKVFFLLPIEEKRKILMTTEYPYGYSGDEILSLSETEEVQLPDLKETFQVMLGNE